MLAIGSIVWGVDDLRRAVDFWCKALDYSPKQPHKGFISPEDDWIILVPSDPARQGVQLALDLNTSGKRKAQSPARHHLDLYATDQKAEVDRLIGLGARRADREYPEDADYVVLEDPEGNPFCIVQVPEGAM